MLESKGYVELEVMLKSSEEAKRILFVPIL